MYNFLSLSYLHNQKMISQNTNFLKENLSEDKNWYILKNSLI
ncbi:hypothetical protein RIEPE_0478 [Candidatus Riesia pediculicola USDA]|uniref:Uncharacterized protein n=1 Tax=Riesia pediculicola (strain USDA) TaxID=515618 RepID=D4G8Q8_RIEPU|nr:hypothetical protein RIEPE_0478 [Candidatus Riesia pediculicola USDA]